MKHLVTIMVDGQPMSASIRIGDDVDTEPSDEETQTPPEETEEEITEQEALDIITGGTT